MKKLLIVLSVLSFFFIACHNETAVSNKTLDTMDSIIVRITKRNKSIEEDIRFLHEVDSLLNEYNKTLKEINISLK